MQTEIEANDKLPTLIEYDREKLLKVLTVLKPITGKYWFARCVHLRRLENGDTRLYATDDGSHGLVCVTLRADVCSLSHAHPDAAVIAVDGIAKLKAYVEPTIVDGDASHLDFEAVIPTAERLREARAEEHEEAREEESESHHDFDAALLARHLAAIAAIGFGKVELIFGGERDPLLVQPFNESNIDGVVSALSVVAPFLR